MAMDPRRTGKSGRILLAAVSCLIMSTCHNDQAPNAPTNPEKPNILLITIDTLRADHLSCYGYYRETSPAIDRFAARSVVFENAETASTITLPSHASIMTSLYPRQHGAVSNYWTVNEEPVFLAEALSAAGYRTGAVIGAWVLNRDTGMNQGFQHFDDSPPMAAKKEGDNSEVIGWGKLSGEVLPAGKNFIENSPADRPWFLWLHLWDTHTPYYTSREYLNFFKPDLTLERRRNRLGLNPYAPNRTSIYDSAIRSLDAILGDFLEWMESSGRLETTLVIITSDHGEGLYEHGERLHGLYVYESTSRVPLIISPPGDKPGAGAVQCRVSTLDVAPFIYDYLDIEPPPQVQGTSLMPFIRDKQAPCQPAVFIRRSWFPPQKPRDAQDWLAGETFAVVKQGKKYIWNSVGPDELYDLGADPDEVNNLAGTDPAFDRSLLVLIDRHLEKIGPMPRERPPVSSQREKGLRSLGYVE